MMRKLIHGKNDLHRFTLSPVLINEKQLHAGVKGSSLGLKSLKIQDFKLKSSSTICVE